MVGGPKIKSDRTSQNDPIIKYLLKVRHDHAGQQNKDYSHVFRKKSRFDIVRLSAIAVGIELAYAAETAFVSPILLQIGIEHRHMTMVWGLSPLLGFFFSPILGSLSDRCRLSIGRRRPIISLLSFGILLGLLLVPYGKDVANLLIPSSDPDTMFIEYNITESLMGNLTTEMRPTITDNLKLAAVFTVLGTILLDFSADTCQTPARAYLLDVCIPEDHAKSLSTFTIMAGVGGTIGYAIGGIDWDSTLIGNFMGGNVPTVFMIITLCFLFCFLTTITSFREIPLPLIENDSLLRPLSAKDIKQEQSKNNQPSYYLKQITSLELKLADNNMNISKPGLNESVFTIATGGMRDIEASEASSAKGVVDKKITLKQYLKSIVLMPKSIIALSLTNLFCWMGHVCYCLYFTDFVGEAVFHGDPAAPTGTEAFDLYHAGVRFGCWGMSIYALSCALYSMLVEKLMSYFGIKTVYIGGILVYALGMLILAIWPTKLGVLFLSTTSGIIYATLFTIPYILIAKYHDKGCFKVKLGENVPLKNARGLGTDIAIVSSMVFVAQLIISLTIGSLVSWLNTTSAILYAASGLSICAAVSGFFVFYI